MNWKIKLLNNWAQESRQMQKIKAINVNSITWTPCDIAHVGQRYYDALAKIQKLRCHIHRNEWHLRSIRDPGFAVKVSQNSWTDDRRQTSRQLHKIVRIRDQQRTIKRLSHDSKILIAQLGVWKEMLWVQHKLNSQWTKAVERVLSEVRLRSEGLAPHLMINFSFWPS